MEATWKPVAAGILNITLGILNLFGMFMIIGLLVAFGGGILTIVRIAEFMPLMDVRNGTWDTDNSGYCTGSIKFVALNWWNLCNSKEGMGPGTGWFHSRHIAGSTTGYYIHRTGSAIQK
jgi:hypothetical protein